MEHQLSLRSLRPTGLAFAAAALTIAGATVGCVDDAAAKQSAASKKLAEAARLCEKAADAEGAADRAEAYRRAASMAGGISDAADGQVAAAALIAASASQGASRAELERASQAYSMASRELLAAARLESAAAMMDGVADAMEAGSFNVEGLDAARSQLATALAVFGDASEALASELEGARGTADAARASAAAAVLEAATLITEAEGTLPLERLQALAEAQSLRLRGIEAREASALATIAASSIEAQKGSNDAATAALEQNREGLEAVAATQEKMTEIAAAAARDARDQAEAVRSQAAELRDNAAKRVEDDVIPALEAATLAAESAVSQSGRASRNQAIGSGAKSVAAQAAIDRVRIEVLRAQASQADALTAALEALDAAKEAVQQVGDDRLIESVSQLEVVVRGGRIEVQPPVTGGTADDDDAMGSDGNDADGGSGAPAVRNTGGLDSAQAIFELISGADADYTQWPQAFGTQDPSLGAVVGAMRTMAAATIEPLASAAVAQWGNASGLLLPDGAAPDSTPTLNEDGTESATIDVAMADGSSKSVVLFAQDGKWFVEIGSLVNDPTELQGMAMMAPQLAMLQPLITAAAEQVAGDIRSGVLTGPAAIKPALAAAIQAQIQAMSGGGAPGAPGDGPDAPSGD